MQDILTKKKKGGQIDQSNSNIQKDHGSLSFISSTNMILYEKKRRETCRITEIGS